MNSSNDRQETGAVTATPSSVTLPCRKGKSRRPSEEFPDTPAAEKEGQLEELHRQQGEPLGFEASLANYADLYQYSPVAYLSVNQAGLILEANLRARKLLGLPPDAPINQHLVEFISPEDYEHCHLFRRPSPENCQTERLELRLLQHASEPRWVRLESNALVRPDGTAIHRIALIDINKEKESEAELRRFRKIAQATIDKSHTHLVYLDRDFNFVAVNDIYARSCRHSPEELLGRNHFHFFPHEENEAIFRHARGTGQPVSFHDKPFIFPDQPEKVTWWDWTLTPVKDESDQVEGLVFSLTETTVRKQAEQALSRALAESRARAAEVAALLESSGIILNTTDFGKAARTIIDISRSLIGASGGFASFFTAVPEPGEIISLETGSCSADPALSAIMKCMREQVHRLGKTVCENDFPHSRWMDPMPPGHCCPENILVVPVATGGTPQGVLGLTDKLHGFADNDQRLLTAFAELVAISLRNSQMIDSLREKEKKLKKAYDILEERVKDRTRELVQVNQQLVKEMEERKRGEQNLQIEHDLQAILSKSTAVLLFRRNRETIVRLICEVAVASGHFRLAWVGFPDAEGRVGIFGAVGPAASYLEGIEITVDGAKASGQGPTGTCIRTNRTLTNEDFALVPKNHPWRGRALAHGLRSSVALPIREETSCIGALSLYSPIPGFFTTTRIAMLEQLASNLSYSLGLFKAEKLTRAATEALRQSEEKYRIVADNTHDWGFWIDPQGLYLYVSPSCQRITGYSPQEFTDDPELMTKILHPEDLPRYLEHRHSAENPSETLTFRIIRPDGRERWIEHICQPVFNENGGFLGNRGSNRDITARKAAENQVLQSKKMLQAVFDSIAEPLTLMDRNMIVLMVNMPAVHYYRLKSPQELIGKPGCWIKTTKAEQCAACPIPSAVAQGRQMSFLRAGYMDPERVESVTIFPVSTEHGMEAGAVIRISDITEAKKMEKSLLRTEKLASIGVLSSGVAHEINNPNNFIMFNVPVLRRYLGALLPLFRKQAAVHGDPGLFGIPLAEFERDIFELADSIEKGSERIKNIVAELKDFSGIDSQEETAWGNPAKTIAQAVRISRVQLKDRVERLDIDIPADLPEIYFEPRGLEQVIVNILINAAQAADKADSWIGLKAIVEDPEKLHFLIEIADNGCGIDEKSLKKIFDPFYTTKPPGLGTGLGLYVCHNMMLKMDGRINVESRVGRGTTFSLVLRCRGSNSDEKSAVNAMPNNIPRQSEA